MIAMEGCHPFVKDAFGIGADDDNFVPQRTGRNLSGENINERISRKIFRASEIEQNLEELGVGRSDVSSVIGAEGAKACLTQEKSPFIRGIRRRLHALSF